MRQITEVLRLNAQGLSYRQIAQSVGISASTVQSYLERAQRAGLSWPLPNDLDDGAIEAQLFTRTEEELRPGRPEPNWLEVHRQRKRGKHVTLQLLHLEYKAVHPEGQVRLGVLVGIGDGAAAETSRIVGHDCVVVGE
jgi:transposase